MDIGLEVSIDLAQKTLYFIEPREGLSSFCIAKSQDTAAAVVQGGWASKSSREAPIFTPELAGGT